MPTTNKEFSNKEILLLGASGTGSPPSTVGDGLPIRPGVDQAMLCLRGSSAGGTLEVTIRIWLWEPITAAWYPASVGSGAGAALNTQGVMNGGVKFEEIAADTLRGAEPIQGLRNFSRIAAEVIAISGTTPNIDLDVVWVPRGVLS